MIKFTDISDIKDEFYHSKQKLIDNKMDKAVVVKTKHDDADNMPLRHIWVTQESDSVFLNVKLDDGVYRVGLTKK